MFKKRLFEVVNTPNKVFFNKHYDFSNTDNSYINIVSSNYRDIHVKHINETYLSWKSHS